MEQLVKTEQRRGWDGKERQVLYCDHPARRTRRARRSPERQLGSVHHLGLPRGNLGPDGVERLVGAARSGKVLPVRLAGSAGSRDGSKTYGLPRLAGFEHSGIGVGRLGADVVDPRVPFRRHLRSVPVRLSPSPSAGAQVQGAAYRGVVHPAVSPHRLTRVLVEFVPVAAPSGGLECRERTCLCPRDGRP